MSAQQLFSFSENLMADLSAEDESMITGGSGKGHGGGSKGGRGSRGRGSKGGRGSRGRGGRSKGSGCGCYC